MSTSPTQSSAPTVPGYPFAESNQPSTMPIGPSSPQVPMPELMAAPYILILKTQVASGPVIAEASVGGSYIAGWRIILGIWSMLVPIPCESSPPHLLSRKDMTAKPTI